MCILCVCMYIYICVYVCVYNQVLSNHFAPQYTFRVCRRNKSLANLDMALEIVHLFQKPPRFTLRCNCKRVTLLSKWRPARAMGCGGSPNYRMLAGNEEPLPELVNQVNKCCLNMCELSTGCACKLQIGLGT